MAKLTVEVEVMEVEVRAKVKTIVNGRSWYQTVPIISMTKELWDELSEKMDEIK